MKGFTVDELLNIRHSWETMGFCKGKLPSTMILDQHGNERPPYMTMNGIIIDQVSPEFRNRTRKILMFSPSAIIPALAEIESAYNDVIEKEVRAF